MKEVTENYFIGINEGRRLWNMLMNRDEHIAVEDMVRFAANCSANLNRGFGKEMADLFRGERDFWLNQIKRRNKNIIKVRA